MPAIDLKRRLLALFALLMLALTFAWNPLPGASLAETIQQWKQ